MRLLVLLLQLVLLLLQLVLLLLQLVRPGCRGIKLVIPWLDFNAGLLCSWLLPSCCSAIYIRWGPRILAPRLLPFISQWLDT